MSRVTKQQLIALEELAALDRIWLGCLALSSRWSLARQQRIMAQLIAKGWVRAEPRVDGRAVYTLRTRGVASFETSPRLAHSPTAVVTDGVSRAAIAMAAPVLEYRIAGDPVWHSAIGRDGETEQDLAAFLERYYADAGAVETRTRERSAGA